MSSHYRATGEFFVPTYGKGRTKQTFAKESDINNIMKKFQRSGTVTHLAKHSAQYGDVTSVDLHEALNTITQAQSMFNDLPSEVRNEFDQDPGKFLDFVQDPANAGDLAEKLPALAEPGRQLPVVRGEPLEFGGAVEEATAEAPVAPSEPPVEA